MNNIKTFESFINGTDSHVYEKTSNGGVSDDEAQRENELMASTESAIDDLIANIKKEANDIGGSFRSPGIESRVGKLLKEKLTKAKLIK
jgi:hypothetical protein